MWDERTPVLEWVVRGHRRSLTLWALALVAVATMYISFYPAIGGEEMAAMTEDLPEAMIDAFGYEDLGSAAGYVSSTVYGVLGPILLLVFAIGLGARMLAGEEEDGTLELELTGPTARRSVYLQRLTAVVAEVTALSVVLWLAGVALVTMLGLDVGIGRLAQASLALGLLALAFAMLSLAVGAATGRRALALAVAAGLGVLSFLFDALGPSADAGWMTAVSPFSWYKDPSPLLHGADPLGLVLLAALALAAGVAGMLRFERRDLMV